MKITRVGFLLFFVSASASFSTLRAQTSYTWNGGSANSNNWSDFDNWGGNGLTFGTTVDLTFAGTKRTTNNDDMFRVGGVNFRSFTINSTADFAITGNAINWYGNFTVSNTGSNGDSWATSLALQSGTHTVSVASTSAAVELTLSGNLSGAGNLTKTGAGMLSLNGTGNTFTGAITVSAGTVGIGSGGGIDTASGVNLTASGTKFDFSSAGGAKTMKDLAGVAGSALSLGGNTLTLGTSNSTQFAGVVTGTGALVKQNAGTLTLTGTNTYSGGTSIRGGVLNIAADANLGSGALTLGGGGLLASASLTTSKNATLGTGTNTLAVATGSTLTENGTISGAGALTVGDGTNAGTVLLGGTNTYSGGTTVSSGVLHYTDDSNLGTGNLTLAGGELLYTSDVSLFASTKGITLGAGTNVMATGLEAIYQGVVGGTGSLTIGDGTNSGAILLLGTETYTGATTVVGGAGFIVQGSIASSSSLSLTGSGAGFYVSGAQTVQNLSGVSGSQIFLGIGYLTVNSSSNTEFDGVINDSGNGNGIVKQGSGKLILGGANTYSGSTTVSGGTLEVSADNNLGTGAVNLGGGELLAGGSFSSAKTFTLNAGANILASVDGANLTLTGGMSGTGVLTVGDGTNTGTVTLNGTNTLSGGLTVNQATLAFLSPTNLSTGDITLTGGELLNTNSATVTTQTNNVVLGAGTNILAATSATAYSGVVSGTGNLTIGDGVTPGGSITLKATETYTGSTVVQAHSTLVVQGSIATSSGVFLNGSGAALQISNSNGSTIQGLTGVGGSQVQLSSGNLTINSSTATEFDGVLASASSSKAAARSPLAVPAPTSAPPRLAAAPWP